MERSLCFSGDICKTIFMKTLGIETSCDETAVALYDSASGIIAETVYSQIDLHKKYGGCLLYTSDAADDRICVDLGGRRIIKNIDNFFTMVS